LLTVAARALLLGAQLKRIFGTILSAKLSEFDDEIRPMAEPITMATIGIYRMVAKELLPTPSKSHYLFNTRDLAKIIQVRGEQWGEQWGEQCDLHAPTAPAAVCAKRAAPTQRGAWADCMHAPPVATRFCAFARGRTMSPATSHADARTPGGALGTRHACSGAACIESGEIGARKSFFRELLNERTIPIPRALASSL
jgi:hypothetical protein